MKKKVFFLNYFYSLLLLFSFIIYDINRMHRILPSIIIFFKSLNHNDFPNCPTKNLTLIWLKLIFLKKNLSTTHCSIKKKKNPYDKFKINFGCIFDDIQHFTICCIIPIEAVRKMSIFFFDKILCLGKWKNMYFQLKP